MAKSAASRRINLEQLRAALLADEEFLAAIAASLSSQQTQPDYSEIPERSNESSTMVDDSLMSPETAGLLTRGEEMMRVGREIQDIQEQREALREMARARRQQEDEQ